MNIKNPSSKMNQKVFIKTYGCQMNVYDSQRMEDSLTSEGYNRTEDINEADLILLNTCHIREKAAEKLYSDLGRLKLLKKKQLATGKNITIGVTGCVAQAEGKEIRRRAPIVDLVLGPQSYHRLPEFLTEVKNGKNIIDTEFAVEDKFAQDIKVSNTTIKKRGVSAFVTIQEGCDKFCTFCVVPYTRGMEVSRPVHQIVTEVNKLLDAGVREITLLGQNVNAWQGKDDNGNLWSLGDLLYHLAEFKDLYRLRYTTSHPLDMDLKLIEAHRDIPKLMPYLHLPIQSGSDKILKAMNRRHTADQYRELIYTIREYCPEIALSGDFIVGFPGETDKDFEDTLTLVKDIFYASSYSFKYSPRTGTTGALMEQQIEESVKNERLQILQNLLLEQQHSFQKSKINMKTQILIEKLGKHPEQMVGRSPWLLPMVIEGNYEIGSLIDVHVDEIRSNSLLVSALSNINKENLIYG
ncbi:tRNA (N6-isopentenyl adenosine(37)-C2)-methylthiotransferase MiaB [Bartonella sp. DGB1]|uniref:tRNA (N6-isopentenyl adenosine(37)-C2)-methylthiotransferase MiaB n=1 Tax=Bartonella sp. DGB1 TaxID=3239807 RepID=UPI0035253250